MVESGDVRTQVQLLCGEGSTRRSILDYFDGDVKRATAVGAAYLYMEHQLQIGKNHELLDSLQGFARKRGFLSLAYVHLSAKEAKALVDFLVAKTGEKPLIPLRGPIEPESVTRIEACRLSREQEARARECDRAVKDAVDALRYAAKLTRGLTNEVKATEYDQLLVTLEDCLAACRKGVA